MAFISETERAAPDDELKQGDILRVECADGKLQVPGLGVVINADCDLAHNKTDGVLAYLAVYTFRDYLDAFWAPAHIEQIKANLTAKILEAVCDTDASAANLHEMVRSVPVGDLARDLEQAARNNGKKLPNSEELVAKLAITVRSEDQPLERFKKLCGAERTPEQYARKQITEARRALGDGNFFVSDIVDEQNVGFVVRLRRIWTIPLTACFTSMAAQRAHGTTHGTTAYRVGRFTSLYKFKLMQLFAHQYSRIGLPDEVTALSQLAIDDLVQALTKADK